MSTLSIIAVVVVGLAAVVLGMNGLIMWRMRAMKGRPLPPLPGPIGERIARAQRALLYFQSPQCGACRTLTPKVRKLSERNRDVHVVDVSTQFELARALKVLATPSMVEVERGRITEVHVGPVGAEGLLARYAS